MQYHVNQNKKAALQEQAFHGTGMQAVQRNVSQALLALALLDAMVCILLYRPENPMPTERFALCMCLLGGSLLFYAYMLFCAFRRVRLYSKRDREELSLTDRFLRYSYLNTGTKLRVEYEIPIAEVRQVERHQSMALWCLTGDFEMRVSKPDAPDDDPAVLNMPCLLLGDYFDGAEDMLKQLGDRAQ